MIPSSSAIFLIDFTSSAKSAGNGTRATTSKSGRQALPVELKHSGPDSRSRPCSSEALEGLAGLMRPASPRNNHMGSRPASARAVHSKTVPSPHRKPWKIRRKRHTDRSPLLAPGKARPIVCRERRTVASRSPCREPPAVAQRGQGVECSFQTSAPMSPSAPSRHFAFVPLTDMLMVLHSTN
jgi:hypothetical protein